MKRGDQARESVKNTIIEAFRANGAYVDFVDKKIYVTARDGDNGEVLQFAVSLTMPKIPIESGGSAAGAFEIEDTSASPQSTELSQNDKEAVERLKKQLGIV